MLLWLFVFVVFSNTHCKFNSLFTPPSPLSWTILPVILGIYAQDMLELSVDVSTSKMVDWLIDYPSTERNICFVVF